MRNSVCIEEMHVTAEFVSTPHAPVNAIDNPLNAYRMNEVDIDGLVTRVLLETLNTMVIRL